MSIVVSHPTGNQNVRAILNVFDNKNVLDRFITSVAVSDDFRYINVLGPLSNELKKRSYPESIYRNTLTHPMKEMGRMISKALKLSSLTKHETGLFSVDNVYTDIDKFTSNYISKHRDNIRAIYSYEDCALETFRKANQLNISKIYELPIAYWFYARKLLQNEANRLPDWAVTLGGGISDSHAKLERKTEEILLADKIIVPSKFVADSLPDTIDSKKVLMVPFGSPMNINSNVESVTNKTNNKKLRVLFVGGMGQRKGLGDLFKAIKLLHSNAIELVVLGSLLTDISFYNNQLDSFTYEGLKPHSEVLQIMASCDVFCLPSIVEGRALVLQEAMSQGLPLIITPNTGGDDLIEEGKTGFLVPCGQPEKIAEKIQWFVDNIKYLPEMKIMAKKKAEEYTWKFYGETIYNGIKELL